MLLFSFQQLMEQLQVCENWEVTICGSYVVI